MPKFYKRFKMKLREKKLPFTRIQVHFFKVEERACLGADRI